MQHATSLFDEPEEAAAASRLIIDSINFQTGIVAEQKSADSAMTDEKYIACSISSQDVFDLVYGAQLGVDCPLPSLNADKGLREKLIGQDLEYARCEETCR